MPILLWLFLAPLFASIVMFLVPFKGRSMKGIAFALSLIPLILLLLGGNRWLSAEVSYPWLPALSIHFHLKVDSLSLVFLYLTAIIIPISILAVRSGDLFFPTFFYGLVLLLETLLIGFFTARDLAVFTIFWEAMLIPLYFIITLWGEKNRQTAGLKFLIYMIGGSVLMVAAVLGLYITSAAGGAGTFDMGALAHVSSTARYSMWLGAIFLLAFAVKTPLFPFHAWLPEAYCQAPTAGSILLAALLSKAGIYGIARIGLELFPTLIQAWSPWLLSLAIIGVLYGGLAAWMQPDFKRLIAYSSFSHVNFILVGLFVWNQTAHSGAILQAFNHGIIITGLFLVAGWLEARIGSTSMSPFQGMAKFLPHLCWLTLVFVLASVALPGTNGFIGELLILFGLFSVKPWMTAILTLSVILSVIYMLRWMQKVYFESPSYHQDNWVDIKAREFAIAAPLVSLIFWIGIYPAPLLELTQQATTENTQVASLEGLK